MDLAKLRSALEARAVAADAEPMAAYMKWRSPFLGVKTPARREASKPFIAEGRDSSVAEIVSFIDGCWEQPEREFQYVGSDMARRWSKRFEASNLPDLRRWITTASWWDTVDALAVHPLGTVVRTNPELQHVMDEWIDDDDFWLARSAILHQLNWKDATDENRLFDYCEKRADDPEFFIRKALGWALRQYARTDPDAVWMFVDANESRLSNLTRREALKHLI